jgi:RsiW-degrading membrane proteinase PrsW (M82 family)
MKLRLTMTSGSLAGRQYDLETGFLTIGRGETCTVRFDPLAERIASKQHAFIEARPDGFYITDNQSTNGTLVNGERVETAQLASGDEVRFGRNGVTARIDIEPSAGRPQSDFTREDFEQREALQNGQAIQPRPASIQSSLSQLGLGSVSSTAPKPASRGKYIGIGVTIFALVFLAMVIGLLMFWLLGIVPALIAATVAFLPAIFYLLPFMFLDRYDPEPLWLLALAFAWGAIVAVLVSLFVNSIVEIVAALMALAIGLPPELGSVVASVTSAPIFEEGSKGLGLLILLIFFRKYFDDILDGIVFAGVIALGFATVENVLYYGRGLLGGGLAGLVLTFGLRGILSPFAHATFTSMTGIGCGIARESHKTYVRVLMPIVGYVIAMLLHMTWNGMAIVIAIVLNVAGLTSTCDAIGLGGPQNLGNCGFFIGYGILEVPLFLIWVIFALLIMRRQHRILKEMLAIDVARGLIPEEHGRIAMSAFRSIGWLLGGIFNGKIFIRSRYLRSLGKLGLSYWHIQRATAAEGQTGSFQQNPILREQVVELRDKV